MHLRRLILFILLSLNSGTVFGLDSLFYLSKDEVISIVKKFHPVVKQADVRIDRMGFEVTSARGAFDPRISAVSRQKTLDGKQYYNYLNPELKIPTWYGIDIQAGMEETYGSNVNPESTFGKSSYAGVNMSILNGLLFDERRATLRKAIAYRSMSEVEKMLVENNTVLDAVTKYWEWVNAYYTYTLYSRVIEVNKNRLKFIRLEYEQGNRAAIDTVEAITQLQTYLLAENEAWVKFLNTGIELSTFLWMDSNTPFEWHDNILPDTMELHRRVAPENIPALELLISKAYANHPKLNLFEYKFQALQIEKKLKQQEFLPTVNVKANLLNKGYKTPENLSMAFLENNYAAGVELKMPLLFRKSYGGYKATTLKIRETELEQSYTQIQIENKIKAYYTEVTNLYKQIALYEDAYQNFHRMYYAEMTRYDIGESNLFLINSRENKLLQTNQKLIELKAKWHIKYISLLWAVGVINYS
ncbi:MAG: TolC family protein [Chitinophagaceae bacterium]|nr:TolC family protein [Chitinophagaceae bacterium]MCB9045013.1 TolC family protein [Chitinophagales bacterium]